MLLHGDEIGRTQRGNNNAYCQDNEISWVDWTRARHGHAGLHPGGLAASRAEHPVLRRRRFFQGGGHGDGLSDIAWFTPSGDHMTAEDWGVGFAKSLAVFLNGAAISRARHAR